MRPGPDRPASRAGVERRSAGLPAGAPPAAHRASVESSVEVSRRRSRPMIGAESSPGIHGGIRPAFVRRTMPAACALASAAVVSENGAMPPSRWHEAHLASRIGATSRLYVGPDKRVDAEGVLARISFSTELSRLSDVDFVVENVTEDWAVKKPVYQELDRICPPHAVFAVEVGPSRLIACSRLQRAVLDNAGGYLWSLAHNDLYREWYRRSLRHRTLEVARRARRQLRG